MHGSITGGGGGGGALLICVLSVRPLFTTVCRSYHICIAQIIWTRQRHGVTVRGPASEP